MINESSKKSNESVGLVLPEPEEAEHLEIPDWERSVKGAPGEMTAGAGEESGHGPRGEVATTGRRFNRFKEKYFSKAAIEITNKTTAETVCSPLK